MLTKIVGGALALFAAGCFDPSLQRPACGPEGECPEGLVCGAQEVCEYGTAGTCAELTCDPNAACVATGAPACKCNPGYTGDGLTCTDIDECASGNAGCAASCQNTPGGFVCGGAPATCAEAKAGLPAAMDGEYTLYLGGDPARPWRAYCAQMADTPLEYLSLTGVNVAQYTAGGDSPGTDVTTSYTKVRFDPATLEVDIADRRFATSTGKLDHSNANVLVTSMPFGVAMDCVGVKSQTGLASIDLTATSFALTGGSAFARAGFDAASSIVLSAGNKRALLAGGGLCGWIGPVGLPVDPFNDNVKNGLLLPLVYQP